MGVERRGPADFSLYARTKGRVREATIFAARMDDGLEPIEVFAREVKMLIDLDAGDLLRTATGHDPGFGWV